MTPKNSFLAGLNQQPSTAANQARPREAERATRRSTGESTGIRNGGRSDDAEAVPAAMQPTGQEWWDMDKEYVEAHGSTIVGNGKDDRSRITSGMLDG